MLKLRSANLLVLVLVLFARTADAFFDSPYITPVGPVAGEIVSVHIPTGICDGIFGREGYPQVTRNGNAIRILEYGHHYEVGDELCIYPIATPSDAIGGFPPGNYTLTVDLAYYDSFGDPSTLTIGVVPFSVAAPSAIATPLPTNNLASLWALALSLLGAAALAFRSRRSSS
ncbi:MAG: hypothetical protein ABIS07_17855 [Dokdonella sp.]